MATVTFTTTITAPNLTKAQIIERVAIGLIYKKGKKKGESKEDYGKRVVKEVLMRAAKAGDNEIKSIARDIANPLADSEFS